MFFVRFLFCNNSKYILPKKATEQSWEQNVHFSWFVLLLCLNWRKSHGCPRTFDHVVHLCGVYDDRGFVVVKKIFIKVSGVLTPTSLPAPTEQQQLSGADEGPHRRSQAQTPSTGQPREAQNPQAERGFPQSPGPAAGIPLLKPPPPMLRLPLSSLQRKFPLRLLRIEKLYRPNQQTT